MEPLGRRRQISQTDLITSALLLATAGYFGTSAWRNLKIGSPGAMGPGYFPLMCATMLAILATVIGIRAFRHGSRPGRMAGLRATGLILGAPLLFALLIGPAGFIPAVALSSFAACWSSRLMTLRFALLVVLCLTVLSTVLFVTMLKMPVTLFGAWAGI